MTVSHHFSGPHPVTTVQGALSYDQLGITDAHNHLWIDSVPGADPESPVLNRFEPILADLVEFREQGGSTILDCQPAECGRDGNQLLALSKSSGVHVIACTGFHLKKYYPQDHWLWQANAGDVCEFIRGELQQGLVETRNTPSPVRPGFIKIALEANWADCPHAALEGAAHAALDTNALMAVHTERGLLAERACVYFTNLGLSASQLVFCHMDKRPDIGLQKEMARLGVMLEYDTFFRPRYNPATNLWLLVEQLISAGFSSQIAFATDMAGADHYHNRGSGLGLASLPCDLKDQLSSRDIPEEIQARLLGGNIARRLAGID